MVKYEDMCVGCPTEMGCLGKSCPYMGVPVYYCDTCGNENAEFHYEGEDICEECLDKEISRLWATQTAEQKSVSLSERGLSETELDEIFDDLSRSEKIETLDMYVSKVGD